MRASIAAAFACVLGACSIDPLDVTGRPCPCPSGWTCDPATSTCARAPGTIDAGDCDPEGDGDGDGVTDCADNCPAIDNAAQDDEDGDATGDACDGCPGDADDGRDADGDRVGDACDPNPDRPIDRIVLFEGFHDFIPSGWNARGAWTQVGDDVAVTSGPGTIEWLVVEDPAPTSTIHLVSRVTVVEIFEPPTSSSYVSIAHNFDPAADSSVRCLVGIRTATTPPAFALRDTGGVSLVVEVPYPYAAGMTERLTFTRDGATFTCANGEHTLTGDSPVTAAPNQLGLRTRSASARYAWMMIITSE